VRIHTLLHEFQHDYRAYREYREITGAEMPDLDFKTAPPHLVQGFALICCDYNSQKNIRNHYFLNFSRETTAITCHFLIQVNKLRRNISEEPRRAPLIEHLSSAP
jgi:hypothetical protein